MADGQFVPVSYPVDCESLYGQDICKYLASIKTRFESINGLITNIQTAIDDLEDEREDMEEELEQKQDDYNDLRAYFNAQNDQELREMVARDLGDKILEIETLQKQLNAKDQRIAQMQKLLENMQGPLQEVDKNLTATESRLNQIHTTVGSKRRRMAVDSTGVSEAPPSIPVVSRFSDAISTAVTQRRTQREKDEYGFNKAVSIFKYYPIWLNEYNNIQRLRAERGKTVGPTTEFQGTSNAMKGQLEQLPVPFIMETDQMRQDVANLFSAPDGRDPGWFERIDINAIERAMEYLGNRTFERRTVRDAARA